MENSTDITLGDKVVPIAIRRSKLAKRISLRIPPSKNKVFVTLPTRAPVAAGMKFLNSKTAWILANIDINSSVAFTDGAIIPVLGKDYIIKCLDGRGMPYLDEENECIVVYCMPEFTARRVKDFLKKVLRDECEKRALEHAALLGRTITRVTVSKANSRWGSCSTKGALSFNWLLVFAPLQILDYIIAHEVAHLKEMNHSSRFWQLVEKIHPAMKSARKWLRKEGHKLHRYE